MAQSDRGRMLWSFWRIYIQIEHSVSRSLSGWGLTAAQAHVLLFVLHSGEEGTSLTEMHREFGCSMGTLSTSLKRLREKGYVRVEPCVEDDRRKRLFGTEKGERIRQELDAAVRGAQERPYRGFSEEELATLDRLQEKLLHNLSGCEERSKEAIGA